MANDEYCEMIELPVSSCEMVTVPQKKRAFSTFLRITTLRRFLYDKKCIKKCEIYLQMIIKVL